MSIVTIDEQAFASVPERDRVRIYRLFAEGRAGTRPEAGRLAGLRSTTVSRIVAELLDRRLLVESTRDPGGRGRPAGKLVADPRRLGASVIHIVSQSIAGALVDLSGAVVARRVVEVAEQADNEALAAAMRRLAAELVDATPAGMSHAGTVVSLSGLIDLRLKRWIVASRWPRMRSLAIEQVLAGLGGPVEICRNLDAELRDRVARDPARFEGGTLLLHWGWGIGMAHAVDGRPLAPANGPFGEIGHWRLSALGHRRCGCGNSGCLETGAALWALLPLLRRRWPDLPEDEDALAALLPRCDLLSVAEMEEAVAMVARALANSCRLLFPDRVIVSGPLVANARLWDRFTALVRAEGGIGGLATPQLESLRASHVHEVRGAAVPQLSRAVQALLANRDRDGE